MRSARSSVGGWTPLLAVILGFVALEVAAVVWLSRTWADLLGLGYLLVAPLYYRLVRRLVDAGVSGGVDAVGTSG